MSAHTDRQTGGAGVSDRQTGGASEEQLWARLERQEKEDAQRELEDRDNSDSERVEGEEVKEKITSVITFTHSKASACSTEPSSQVSRDCYM